MRKDQITKFTGKLRAKRVSVKEKGTFHKMQINSTTVKTTIHHIREEINKIKLRTKPIFKKRVRIKRELQNNIDTNTITIKHLKYSGNMFNSNNIKDLICTLNNILYMFQMPLKIHQILFSPKK